MTDETEEAHPSLLSQGFLHFARVKRMGRPGAYSKSASGADPYAVSG